MRRSLVQLEQLIPCCTRCPELRAYCAEVARTRRRAFAEQTYWGRPVTGFGDRRAKILIVGLAPAAHGANRTGRMFTGDRSGDFLYAALHRAGLANQAESVHADDGLRLRGVYIGASLRCAPPANRPTPSQLDRCRSWLIDELRAMRPRVVIAFGAIAWNSVLAAASASGMSVPRPRPRFGHGAEVRLVDAFTLLGSFHVSQQNTFTGRLTPQMLDAVLEKAKEFASDSAATQRVAQKAES